MAVLALICLVVVVLGVALNVHGNGPRGSFTSQNLMVLILSLLLLIVLIVYLKVDLSIIPTSSDL